MSGVKIVNWNPRRNLVGERLPVRGRVNNFGDLIGPLVVELLLRRAGLAPTRERRPSARLLTVGSILHLARDGDCLWGTGMRGTMAPERYAFDSLDVRAVRGPLTRGFLLERGIDAPRVYGDPALLLPELLPSLGAWSEMKVRSVLVVPNFADYPTLLVRNADRCLDPQRGLMSCLRTIAQSETVIASSLHGVVIADALGIPCRLLASAHETPLKYEDYFLGTGRPAPVPAATVGEAIRELPAGAEPIRPDPALAASFPLDLFTPAGDG